jgi:hypothetical protein
VRNCNPRSTETELSVPHFEAHLDGLRLIALDSRTETLFERGTDQFLAAIEASDALKARARAIQEEIKIALAAALAHSVHRHLPDPVASLATSLLVATWTIALTEAQGIERRAVRLGRNTLPMNEASAGDAAMLTRCLCRQPLRHPLAAPW